MVGLRGPFGEEFALNGWFGFVYGANALKFGVLLLIRLPGDVEYNASARQ